MMSSRGAEKDRTAHEKRVGGSAGRLWADVSMMQSLEEQLNSSGSIAAESRRSFHRGPESYTLPEGVKFDFWDQQQMPDENDGDDGDGKSVRRKVDFFADGDELAAVESFGVDAQSRKRRRHHGERNTVEAVRHYERKFRYTGNREDAPMDASGLALHGQRCNLSGRAIEKRARYTGQHNSRNLFRYGSTSTLGSVESGDMTKEQREERLARLRGLVAQDYSQDQLLNTEFPPDIELAELGALMAKALGERAPEAVKESVESVGKNAAMAIFDATKSAERAGGLLTMNGRRRRTPGGVFLYLTKLWQAGEWRAGEPIPAPTMPAKKEGESDKMNNTSINTDEKPAVKT